MFSPFSRADIPGRGEDTLRDVMARMSAAEVHRIFLCDEAEHLVRIISLGDILAKFTSTVSGTATAS